MAKPEPRSRGVRSRALRWVGAAALVGAVAAVWCGPAVAAVTFTLSTNGSTYQEGMTHVLSAALSSTEAVTGDVYVVLQVPAGDVFSLLASGGFQPGIVPFVSGALLPAGFDFPLQPIFSALLPALPTGGYTWYGAVANAGTATLASNLAQVPFVFTTPAPPATPVVWMPDFFGSRVNVRAGEGADTKSVTLLLDGAGPCSPNSVAVNRGKLYVVCNQPDAIRVYDADAIGTAAAGAVLADQPVETIVTSPEFNELIGVAFDAQENLWVASFAANRLVRIAAADLTLANPPVTTLPNSPDSPVALAFDTDGSLWVAGQFGGGIVLNFPADQLDRGADAQPRYCISNAAPGCGQVPNLFNALEGLALFNGRVWVSNNGGNMPGRELVALRVENGNLVVDAVFGDRAQPTSPFVCPGGLLATSQHLWVNDQGHDDPVNTTCGANDQGSGVGAVLRFTPGQLDARTTDPAQIVRFTNITGRPGFGGLFVEGE